MITRESHKQFAHLSPVLWQFHLNFKQITITNWFEWPLKFQHSSIKQSYTCTFIKIRNKSRFHKTKKWLVKRSGTIQRFVVYWFTIVRFQFHKLLYQTVFQNIFVVMITFNYTLKDQYGDTLIKEMKYIIDSQQSKIISKLIQTFMSCSTFLIFQHKMKRLSKIYFRETNFYLKMQMMSVIPVTWNRLWVFTNITELLIRLIEFTFEMFWYIRQAIKKNEKNILVKLWKTNATNKFKSNTKSSIVLPT